MNTSLSSRADVDAASMRIALALAFSTSAITLYVVAGLLQTLWLLPVGLLALTLIAFRLYPERPPTRVELLQAAGLALLLGATWLAWPQRGETALPSPAHANAVEMGVGLLNAVLLWPLLSEKILRDLLLGALAPAWGPWVASLALSALAALLALVSATPATWALLFALAMCGATLRLRMGTFARALPASLCAALALHAYLGGGEGLVS